MVAPTLLQSIQDLSIGDKLALIEAITQMLQNELQGELQSWPYTNGTSKHSTPVAEPTVNKTGNQDMQALIAELLSQPTPTPDKMLYLGMFQGRIPVDEELFALAEWHPSDEELAGV